MEFLNEIESENQNQENLKTESKENKESDLDRLKNAGKKILLYLLIQQVAFWIVVIKTLI